VLELARGLARSVEFLCGKRAEVSNSGAYLADQKHRWMAQVSPHDMGGADAVATGNWWRLQNSHKPKSDSLGFDR
jgi:hypothetical protein